MAREKPHWGAEGVPFMKSTTGFSRMLTVHLRLKREYGGLRCRLRRELHR